MREESELEAATLQELTKSNEDKEAEELAQFLTLANTCLPHDTINLLNSWENWYENGPPKVTTKFKENRKQKMDPRLFEKFTAKTRKREVIKRGPERCPKGHSLKMMKR